MSVSHVDMFSTACRVQGGPVSGHQNSSQGVYTGAVPKILSREGVVMIHFPLLTLLDQYVLIIL